MAAPPQRRCFPTALRRGRYRCRLSADTTGNLEKTVALMVSGSGPDIFHGWGQLLRPALEWQRARLFQDRSWAPIAGAQRTWQPNTQFDGLFQGVLASIEDGMYAFERVAGGMQGTGNEWGIMHLPTGPARRASLGTTDGWALWKGTRAKDVA